MARRSKSVNTVVPVDAGAFELDANIATIAGYSSIAGGVALAGALGMAVAPLPTLGLAAAGAGLVVAGNFQDIKSHFVGPDAPVMDGSVDTAGVDVTNNGEYQSTNSAGATATTVA